MAWIEVSDVRIDDAGGVLAERLSFGSDGPHLAVLGGPSILGHVLSGRLAPTRGTVSIDGKNAREALLTGALAHAERDPKVPEPWSVLEYVCWSARLVGMSRADAERGARAAVDALKLGAMARTRLGAVPPAARRATQLAAALATGARTIVIDDPIVGLPDDAARSLAKIAAEALERVSWVLLAGRLSLASPLGLSADDAVSIAPGGVVSQGAPADLATRERTYALRVLGSAYALAELVRAKGATVRAADRELVVELGAEMTTGELFALAQEARVTIVAMRPVGAAVE